MRTATRSTPAGSIRKPGVVAADGHTDLGGVFDRFVDRYALDVLSPGTTVLITGDARTNYRADGAASLAQIARLARRVYWLNPEPRAEWGTTDSAVDAYRPHCTDIVEVRNLAQLADFVCGSAEFFAAASPGALAASGAAPPAAQAPPPS